MKALIRPIIFLLFFCCTAVLATDAIVGYYPSWMRDVLPAEQIDLQRLTHINHAFAAPTADGEITYSSSFLYPELNKRVHENGHFILLSLGGWGNSDGFAPMAADSASRSTFVRNVLSFCLNHNYDGVDLDWEHPATAAERDNMTLLVKELREEFSKLMRPQPLFISLAVTASDWRGQWLDYDELKKVVDWFGCMTYDFHGDWSNHAGHNSPLYASGGDVDGSVDSGFQYLTQTRGLAPDQILIGLPFYGRSFNASKLYGPSSGSGSEYRYSDIPPLIEAGWTFHWDDVAHVPYIINPEKTKLISYDDTTSVRLKAEYAIDKKLRGVMIWALGQDVINNSQPLLESLANPILNQTSVGQHRDLQPNEFELVTNYPNPFNAATTIAVSLPNRELVSLSLLDVNGRIVEKIFDGPLEGGKHFFRLTAANLSTGIYLCRLFSNSSVQIHKITHLK